MGSCSPISEFIEAFLKDKGLSSKGISSVSLAGDGSKRLFRRITLSNTGPAFIVMENYPVNDYLKKENMAYLRINRHLFQKCLPVPEIYMFDLANGLFILEDMGDKSLQDEALSHQNRMLLYEKVLDLLFQLQIEGAQGFDAEWCLSLIHI